MRTRHRIPSIFNLSMVDVLCCALGCVILLWLLNLREARLKAAQAGRADEQVVKLKEQADALRRELDDARGRLADLGTQYAAVQGRLDAAEAEAKDLTARLRKTEGDRDAAAARIAQLDKDLAALRGEKATAEDRLARRMREYADLEKKLSASAARVAALEKEVSEQDAAARAATRRGDDLAAKLKDAEARAKALGDEAKGYRDKYLAEEALARGLEKEINKRLRELDEARRSVEALEGEKKSLRGEAERLRIAADNRFAGITLTGRRVVFLVDMSGSMDLIDLKTAAPGKWAGVRETLAKIMRSLPELEKFQVILFSDEVHYLLGGLGRWLDFDRDSIAKVTAAMAKVQPRGDTDMYAAFDAAFRYRPLGLDTIYVLSDGLPNRGEGLTETARDLKETERAEVLTRHIRRKIQSDWNRDVAGRPKVRINAIGFFYESPDVGAFLWALSRENDGSFVGMSKP